MHSCVVPVFEIDQVIIKILNLSNHYEVYRIQDTGYG